LNPELLGGRYLRRARAREQSPFNAIEAIAERRSA
jgi:hypothetical protein